MKKTLKLNRTTLRHLVADSLRNVGGGADSALCPAPTQLSVTCPHEISEACGPRPG